VKITDASLAGMPNGSTQIIEVTTGGILKHDIRNANGSWQNTGWGTPAGSTGIAQAAITAMPNGSTQLVAVTTSGTLEHNLRNANGTWQTTGWGTPAQTTSPPQPPAQASPDCPTAPPRSSRSPRTSRQPTRFSWSAIKPMRTRNNEQFTQTNETQLESRAPGRDRH